MMKLILVLSILGVCGVNGQLLLNGQCDDNIPLVPNFDINQFQDKWYEINSTPTPWGGDCSSIEFTVASGTNAISVNHRNVRQNFVQDYNGNAELTANTARLRLNLPQASSNPINFWILSTDYTNFALAYGCENVGNLQRNVYVWMFGRTPSFSNELIPAHMNVTISDNLGITTNDLQNIDHGEQACLALPIIAPGQPIVLNGQCDQTIQPKANFSVGDFLGTWHEVASYFSENVLGTCSRAQYSLGAAGVDVVNSQVIGGRLFTIEGTASVVSDDGSARLSVTLEVTPGNFQTQELLVLETDYENWAITYTCQNIPNTNTRRIFSWIASRTRILPDNARNEVNSFIDTIFELNNLYYQTTDQTQSGCFYAPDPVFNVPVVFGGQCDLNIATQPNFVAGDYLGQWYDIESYPTPFQGGTCANAYYSLGDEGVDVFNTQVVNERLEIIEGVAIPVGNEAKLVVSFPIAGTNETTQTDYWVISTDYESYSLVYSCRNINDYQQQVTVWKLSRSRQLSNDAIIAINNAMTTIPVISQTYFQPMDQSAVGCFYFPEPTGEVVVFPGQCDTNIAAVQNFNFALFSAAPWYEVEAYPKDTQPGQCISHTFTPVTGSTTTMNLVSNNVVDQLFTQTQGQIVRPAASTEAKFTLTIPLSNGTNIQFPYYIIDVDYNDYALAYSCVNDGDYFRRVFSWKLSRTTQLSTAAATAITTAMTNIVVLGNQYFEPILHTELACYAFPDTLLPGQPVVLTGQCPNIQAKQNFNAAAYLDGWRLLESYPSDNQFGQCNRANYALDGSVVIVRNSEVINQVLTESVGRATLEDPTVGTFTVTFPESPVPFQLHVLETDYESYSLVYGCVNNPNTNTFRVYSWKMSRTRTLSQDSINAINAVMNTITVLNDRYYNIQDHSDDACFYFPEVDGNPVVFPGQCDENIPVKTGFDAAQYLNLWHDISSYPLPFQDGSCPNAFYSLGDGVVDVFNTQVINQTLDTITGFAVLPETPDGQAKLLVTFPTIGNFSTNYWVLETDYEDFAFVYSCTNLDEETRQVSSWKLSRSRTLSPIAIQRINAIQSTIPVIDDRYFINRDQSRAGCFYFPEPQPEVPVVFPGQCDANINVVQNFDLQRFQGTWHEIEAYPKEQQGGDCIRHQFTSGTGNTLNLQSFNVISESLGITDGVLRFASTDNSARMTISFVSNGTTLEIPYWIIDTDYDNFALAYSCVNIGDDYRGVFSWKLSKIKANLTQDINNRIDAAIANIDVLDNRYYETIDQSDDACFYLPDVRPGETVVFPGSCDPDIAVVPNFDAGRYLGRWRLIETYPSEFQLGECNEATYSLNETSGEVIVFNTEVINETLSTIYGSAVPIANGKLLVTFPDVPAPIEYWVLDTDYEDYSIIYSCVDLPNTDEKQIFSWKMSRTNTLSENATNAINAVIDRVRVLNERYYKTVDRSSDACFYFPEVDGNPVVFPGQCDENIPVKTGFDAAQYLNLWHDISSYPLPFQDGSCPNAFYSLGDGVVDVFNTQVIDQTLDTITGFAVLPETPDGQAKLLVTFPTIGNFSTNYWVLETDYEDFAFVYSCTNLDEETRQVSSWKLSRSRTLSPIAIQRINAIQSTIPVIDDRYFINRDQSRAGCFYFPEPQPEVPVVFPGQCDSSINVVQNFDLQRFQGTWHEIEAYPKEQQGGDCIRHQFTSGTGNTLNLQSFNVISESLGITDGVLRFASTDNSARMIISFVSNGTTLEIPYWIIDTDYDNFALAYSCVNIGDDYRGVFSWKLSKIKANLTQDINNRIDAAIANIDVLDNRYYETIDQSDDACFFLPDLAPGEPVIFPNRCEAISPMANFDAGRYLGTWNIIENYPSDFQFGTCGDATYTADENAPGQVIVLNTEVVNQTLSTIDGRASVASNDGSGVLLVTFPDAMVPAVYLVMDTDYESFALVYSCAELPNNERRIYAWKMSRTNTLDATATERINAVMDRVNTLNDRYFLEVDRSEEACFYFPEPDGKPVDFRGSCDQNIPVVGNFQADQYEGIWYNIESYPAPFQDGTCGIANYTLDLETLTVYVVNTQVLDQMLDVQTGTAVLALSDGSAKLNVTFEVNGVIVTTDYWVLDTDYVDFSLVYSCQDLGTGYKRVNSWKLSRSQNLTNNAIGRIEAVMDRTQVLDQRYFVDGDQTEAGCFFYPNNNGGDVILSGQCFQDSEIEAVQDFDPAAFPSDPWFEIARFPSDLQDGECVASDFTFEQNNMITISKTIVIDERQSTNIITGTLPTNTRGAITITGSGVPFANLYILATDNTEFALLYGCRNIDAQYKQIYSWKLSRNSTGLSAAAAEAINQVVSKNIDLFEYYYRATDQSNAACFHYPEFETLPDVIELIGPCDESIRGVANFNAGLYVGRWLELERYPDPNQFGTCDRAEYIPTATGVDVINTQVVDSTLAVQLGNATVASSDGTGQLLVTFDVNGVTLTANYYIIDTDYESFSLVYSCRNLDNGRKQVNSWKLGRTTSLTDAAIARINNAINNTRGLSNDYYQTTEQTENACFYVPDFNTVTGTPRFRGTCQHISRVQNFEAAQFAEWWHEIKRYPVDRSIGQCISSEYTVSGNGLEVVDTEVTNEVAQVSRGTVTVTNDGRLVRTINGVEQEIFVLATDFESYALLYSCEQDPDDEEYVKVWSAQHSVSRTLTETAQAAINASITENRYLFSELYQDVDQSDDACFHYPEQTGNTIIIPGQCDTAIPVVQNFNPRAYEGTWYQIERYPQNYEVANSSCTGARYVFNEAEGVVSLTNWEVVDGVLETIEGTATISSEDGSAKLQVTLPIRGTNETTTSSLYVLLTDYENFALTYGCRNIGNYRREVSAWKLSRRREMLEVGTTAIDNYMTSRRELHQPYFRDVPQSDTCLEPASSAIFFKSSIIVILISVALQYFV